MRSACYHTFFKPFEKIIRAMGKLACHQMYQVVFLSHGLLELLTLRRKVYNLLFKVPSGPTLGCCGCFSLFCPFEIS